MKVLSLWQHVPWQWRPEEVPRNLMPDSVIVEPKSYLYFWSLRLLTVSAEKDVGPPESKLPALVSCTPEHCAPVHVAETTDAPEAVVTSVQKQP